MRMRLLAVIGMTIFVTAGTARTGDATRPGLPADMLLAVGVKDISAFNHAAESFAMAATASLPDGPMRNAKPGDMDRTMRERMPFVAALPAGQPVYLMMENFMPGSKPVLFGVLKLGDLDAFAEAAGGAGLAVEKPDRAGRPWSVAVEGKTLYALPTVDGWVVVADDASATGRIAGKLAKWAPIPLESQVEVMVDFAKAIKLQRPVIDGGLGMMPVILNMQLEQFARRVERMENEGDDRRDEAVRARAILEMGRRALPVLSARSAEIVDALATAGILRMRADFTAGQADFRTEWYPVPGSAMARMVDELAAGKQVDKMWLAQLPAECLFGFARMDTSAVDSNKLEDFVAGTAGDLAYIVDGTEESREEMRRLMLDLFDTGRGEIVTGGGVTPEGYYAGNLDRGAGAAKQAEAAQRFMNRVFKFYVDMISLMLPMAKDQIVLNAVLAEEKDKIEGVGVKTVGVDIQIKPELAAQIPADARRQLERIPATSTNAFSAEAVDGAWIAAGGPGWRTGFAALVKSAKDKASGFGKRPDYDAAGKATGEKNALFAVVYAGDLVKAAVPAFYGMVHGGAEISDEAKATINAIPADVTPMAFAETFGDGKAVVHFNVPALAVSGLINTFRLMDEGKVFEAFVRGPGRPAEPVNAPQGGGAAQGDLF